MPHLHHPPKKHSHPTVVTEVSTGTKPRKRLRKLRDEPLKKPERTPRLKAQPKVAAELRRLRTARLTRSGYKRLDGPRAQPLTERLKAPPKATTLLVLLVI